MTFIYVAIVKINSVITINKAIDNNHQDYVEWRNKFQVMLHYVSRIVHQDKTGARSLLSHDTSWWPSGPQATNKTEFLWPFRTPSTAPVFMFHKDTVLPHAAASRLLSALYARQRAGLLRRISMMHGSVLWTTGPRTNELKIESLLYFVPFEGSSR